FPKFLGLSLIPGGYGANAGKPNQYHEIAEKAKGRKRIVSGQQPTQLLRLLLHQIKPAQGCRLHPGDLRGLGTGVRPAQTWLGGWILKQIIVLLAFQKGGALVSGRPGVWGVLEVSDLIREHHGVRSEISTKDILKQIR